MKRVAGSISGFFIEPKFVNTFSDSEIEYFSLAQQAKIVVH